MEVRLIVVETIDVQLCIYLIFFSFSDYIFEDMKNTKVSAW